MLTPWSGPALATGGWLVPPVTVTTIVSAGLETVPSLTVRLKVRLVAALGAVKVGLTAVVLERLTAGPAVWLQA